MSVSAEEQVNRVRKMGNFFRDVMLTIPVLGDVIGLFFVVGPMLGKIFVRSNSRIIDSLTLLVLVAAFFLSLFFIEWGHWGFALALVVRFLIANKGFAYFERRLG